MKTFARPRLLVLALYIASAALVTVQQAILRHSNNVSIFRSASFNLFAGRDLYAAHPEQHFDFYKYSPTFAVLFAPLAYLPFALTFLCWTLLNGLLLWYALDRLLPEREATVALALLYLEVLLALQYGQSNALVAALMVLAFVAFEARRPVGAAVSITIGAAVKLFPLAALSVAVFHPRRLRFAVIFIAVLAAAIALPLVAIPPGDLLAQYRSWHAIEAKDALRRGYSLMHYVHAWFGVDWPNWPLQAAGTALLLLPVALRPDRWASLEFRRLFLCSLLVYAVLFNHASESPSFVVAYAGIVIWYVSSPPSRVRAAVMALTLLVMVVHDVDVVPRWVKYDLLVRCLVGGRFPSPPPPFAAIFIAVLAAAIALPLVAIPPGDLLAQYRSWHAIEAKDALRRGYSLMHYVHAWFGVDWPNWPLQAAGTALLLLPVALRPDRWASLEFRRLFLCSLLVYSVLFNHASESPSFVVAYAGIVIWYASSPPSRVRTVVMALTLLVMIVHDVDVVPRWVKYDILVPYRIKGIPCLVAWFVMQWELLVTARSTARIDTGSFSPPASAAGA